MCKLFVVDIWSITRVISDLVKMDIRKELHETHIAGREYCAKTLSSDPALVGCELEEIYARIHQ